MEDARRTRDTVWKGFSCSEEFAPISSPLDTFSRLIRTDIKRVTCWVIRECACSTLACTPSTATCPAARQYGIDGGQGCRHERNRSARAPKLLPCATRPCCSCCCCRRAVARRCPRALGRTGWCRHERDRGRALLGGLSHCLSIVFRFDFYVAVLLAVEGASRWPMLRTFPLLLSQHWSERGLLSQHRRVREDHSASHTFTSRSAALRGCHSSCTGID